MPSCHDIAEHALQSTAVWPQVADHQHSCSLGTSCHHLVSHLCIINSTDQMQLAQPWIAWELSVFCDHMPCGEQKA